LVPELGGMRLGGGGGGGSCTYISERSKKIIISKEVSLKCNHNKTEFQTKRNQNVMCSPFQKKMGYVPIRAILTMTRIIVAIYET
jgi:hypothetical protein